MGPEESSLADRMRVFGLIGIDVVVPMVAGPPEGPRCAHDGPTTQRQIDRLREVLNVRCEK